MQRPSGSHTARPARSRGSTGRLLAAMAILLLGSVAFSPMGFALAFWARPKAASAVSNLVFLPLSFLSGFFFPV